MRAAVAVLETLAAPVRGDRRRRRLQRRHLADPRAAACAPSRSVRAVRFKRNFGQHPAMHAGLVRARGDIVVTMDGDLQNSPADLPELDRGGRGRLRRGQRPPTRAARTRGGGRCPHGSSTGCSAASPASTSPTSAAPSTRTARGDHTGPRRDRQAEVHEGARPLGGRERRRGRPRASRPAGQLALLAAPADAARPPRPGRLLAAADPVGGSRPRRPSAPCSRCRGVRVGARRTGSRRTTSPASFSSAGSCSAFSASRASSSRSSASTSDASSATSRAVPSTRSSGSSTSDDAAQARARHRRLRVHPVELHPPPARATPYEVVSLDALTYAGNTANLADVMDHERLSFVHGDIRDPDLVEDVVAEVDVIVNAAAESHVEKSIARGRLRVRDDERRGNADPARRHPRDTGRALHPHLVERGLRHGALRDPMDEEHPLNPRSPYAATKAGADRLAYAYHVTYGLADRHRPAVQQLRPVPASGEGDPALHHAGAARRAAHGARRRQREP